MDKTCRELLARLTAFNIDVLTSFHRGVMPKKSKKESYPISTQHIEGDSLIQGTRIQWLVRETICFSCPAELYKKVISPSLKKHVLLIIGNSLFNRLNLLINLI